MAVIGARSQARFSQLPGPSDTFGLTAALQPIQLFQNPRPLKSGGICANYAAASGYNVRLLRSEIGRGPLVRNQRSVYGPETCFDRSQTLAVRGLLLRRAVNSTMLLS